MNKTRLPRFAASCGLMIVVAGGMASCSGLAQVGGDPIFSPDLGPAVRIVSPVNHEVFYTNEDVPIFAFTRSEATFTNVEFYANGIDLGSGVRLSDTNRAVAQAFASPTVMPPVTLGRLRSLWCLVWTNPSPPGAYALTAVASGYLGQGPSPVGTDVSRTSAPVNITISAAASTVGRTNLVSIVATDPIAIAGTNIFWVWPNTTDAVPSWTNWPPVKWQSFTNWGPKAALFTVRRFGDASSDLTVNYNIGGTASNGVDYVALPGSVDISAGSAYAVIPIVPIDNGSNNVPKTVILTLAPDTNAPPDYLIGCPPRAEAVIIYHWFYPVPLLLPDGSFQLNDSGTNGGPDGAWFCVQSSTDLLNWTSVCTNQAFQGTIEYLDSTAATNPGCFYRVEPLTNSPAQ